MLQIKTFGPVWCTEEDVMVFLQYFLHAEIFIGQCKSHFYCFKINLILVLSFKLRTKIAEVEKHIVLLVHLKFRHFQSLSEVQFKNDMQAL